MNARILSTMYAHLIKYGKYKAINLLYVQYNTRVCGLFILYIEYMNLTDNQQRLRPPL